MPMRTVYLFLGDLPVGFWNKDKGKEASVIGEGNNAGII